MLQSKRDKDLVFQKNEKNFFQFFFKIFIISEKRSTYYAQFILMINMILIFVSAVDYTIIFEVKSIKKSNFYKFGILINFLVTVFYTGTILMYTKYKLDLSCVQQTSTRNFLWVLSILNDSFGFIILPCFAFCISQVKSATVIEQILFWAGYLLCFFITVVTTIFGRNPMKTDNPFSVLDQKAELVYIILLNVYLMLKASFFINLSTLAYFKIFDALLLVMLFIMLRKKYIYWRLDIHVFQQCGVAVLFLFKLYTVIGVQNDLTNMSAMLKDSRIIEIHSIKLIVPIILSTFF